MEKKIILFLVCLLFLGCSDAPQRIFAQIINLKKGGIQSYALHTVEFKHVLDINTVRGENVHLLAGMRLHQDELIEQIKLSTSFDELKNKINEKLVSNPVHPFLKVRNGIYVANSFESLLMLSAYYHFDEIIDFAKRIVAADNKAVSNVLRVGVYGEMTARKSNPIPLITHDNALYITGADAVFLLRVGDQKGLPLSMHPGVLAHEFHHRIFFEEVWANKKFNNLWRLWQKRYSSEEKSKLSKSTVLLNGTDEGLADVFAASFTQSGSYLNHSLASASDQKIKNQRDLNGIFANKATYDNLADSSIDPELRKLCNDHAYGFQNERFNFYCIGTVIAKTLFDAAQGDNNKLIEILKLCYRAMTDIANALSHGKEYDLDIFFESVAKMAKTESKNFYEPLCDEIKHRFFSLYQAGRIPSCVP